VPLLDENTSVVDGLGETELVDASLETTLQEILDLESQDVIELHAGLIEHTDTDQTTNQGVTLEQTLGILLVEGEKLTVFIVRPCSLLRFLFDVFWRLYVPSCTTDLGEGEHDAPHLTLVAETIFANSLQFSVAAHDVNAMNQRLERRTSCRSVAGVY